MKWLSTKFWFFILAVVVLAATIVFTQTQVNATSERPGPPGSPVAGPAGSATPQQQTPAAEVSVVWVHADNYQAKVTAYGASQSHYEVTLTAQVSGQVELVANSLDNGKRVNKGDWLVKLENSDYLSALAQAKQTLADAEVSLLEEQRQSEQALLEWKTSGLTGEPDSELVLRKPQLAAAKSAVTQAKAAVKSAEKDLSYSTIKAPFDALVIERLVSPGSYVQTGTEIANIYSTERIEVEVALSSNEWGLLPTAKQLAGARWPVTLTNVDNGDSWPAYIIRSEQHIDAETRQRSVVIAVDQPLSQTPALYPGSFLKADIQGQSQKPLWKLPSSALSQRGEIWFVSDENTLAKISQTPEFSYDGYIYITPPAELAQQNVAVLAHPLNSYLEGMKVTPVEENDEK